MPFLWTSIVDLVYTTDIFVQGNSVQVFKLWPNDVQNFSSKFKQLKTWYDTTYAVF